MEETPLNKFGEEEAGNCIMGFVNEYISKSDMDFFKIKEIDKNVNIHTRINSDSWTIDRESGVYLRLVATGSQDFAAESSWTLFWEKKLIWIDTKLLDCVGQRNAPGWLRMRITRLCLMGGNSNHLPTDLVDKKDQIIKDFYSALLVYKDGGVYASFTEFKLTLEVADGV